MNEVKDLIGIRMMRRRELLALGLTDFLIRKAISQKMLNPRRVGKGGRRLFVATEVLKLNGGQ